MNFRGSLQGLLDMYSFFLELARTRDFLHAVAQGKAQCEIHVLNAGADGRRAG